MEKVYHTNTKQKKTCHGLFLCQISLRRKVLTGKEGGFIVIKKKQNSIYQEIITLVNVGEPSNYNSQI